MKKKNLTALVAAIALTVVASGSLLCGNGIVSYEGEMDEMQMNNLNSFAATDHCQSIENPYMYSDEQYNCFEGYSVVQLNSNRMNFQIWKNPNDRAPECEYALDQGESKQIIAMANTGSKECRTVNYYLRNVCSVCGAASGHMLTNYDTNQGVCKFPVALTLTTGPIMTSFDQPGAVWDHNGSVGQTIYFSIAYNGIVAEESYSSTNCSIDIPWLGTKTVGPFVIDGVSFWVRVGPNRISIRANQGVWCNGITTVFAFSESQ